MSQSSSKTLFFALLLLLPYAVFGDCTCDPEDEDHDKGLARKYQYVAIACIFLASAVGVCLPALGKVVPALRPEKPIFLLLKAFAAGVILSTGFIHVLPDAFESLTSPCISPHPWGDFPFTGSIAMVSAIGTLMVDTYATVYYRRKANTKGEEDVKDSEAGVVVPVHTHATHGHSHGAVSLDSDSDESELLRHRVITQVQIFN